MRSETFILSAIFCGSLGGEATERPQKVAQVAVSRRFERPALFIGCQHQPALLHHCLGQRTGAALSSENEPYRLLRVQFVACRLSILTTLSRTIGRSNAKLGEGVNPLFLGLLAVFRVENLSTQ